MESPEFAYSWIKVLRFKASHTLKSCQDLSAFLQKLEQTR